VKYDFTFKLNGNRLLRTRFRFEKKKETGKVEDDFTFNVVLHHDDLTLFCKKKFNGPIFINLNLKQPLNTKKPTNSLKVS